MKRLIVTADDVGLHDGMTRGAIRAHRDGIVTACSVAGTGPAFAAAADELKTCPALDVGVHLVLADDYRAFLLRWTLRRVSARAVEAALRAQIERLLAHGLVPVHVNGHQHLHVLPGIIEIVVRLAVEYRIPYLRVPDDRFPPGLPSPRRSALRVLGRLARRAARMAQAAGLRTNTRTIGIVEAGHLTVARLVRLVPSVDGLTELVAHPGVDAAAIGREHAWGYEWEAETAALCDGGVARALAAHRVELVGVRAGAATRA